MTTNIFIIEHMGPLSYIIRLNINQFLIIFYKTNNNNTINQLLFFQSIPNPNPILTL